MDGSTSPLRRTLLHLTLLCSMLVLALALAPRVTRQMPDFEVYHRAAIRAAAGEPLYRAEDQHYQFKYLPTFAVLARPVGALPLASAKHVWFYASVVLLHVLLATSLAVLPVRRRPSWLLVAPTVVVLGKFYGHELVLGQVNLLLAAVVVTAMLALRNGRDATSGLLLALAVIIKPYALLFLPWLAAQHRLRAFAAGAGGLAVGLALPALTYGVNGAIDLHLAWWNTVAESTAPNLLNQDNVSAAAMFAKWLGPGTAAMRLAAGMAAALLALAALIVVRRQPVAHPETLEGSLLLVLVPLVSPQGWDYVFLLSTPAIMLLVNFGDRLVVWLRVLTAVAVATIGLSLFDLMGRANYAAFMALSIITVCFLIVAGALAWLRLRKIA